LSLVIERAAFDHPESVQLMAEMWAELDRIYGNTMASPVHLTGMDQPGAAFLLARESGEAIGCVALRPITGQIAEVKRLFVRPGARGRGLARGLMEKFEQVAAGNGFREIRLETGLLQPAAIRLYDSLGYRPIEKFGEYKDEPLSVCYAKTLE
jgi:GNAT superfamily N-acetyltransferase